jgi:hypothetical protein
MANPPIEHAMQMGQDRLTQAKGMYSNFFPLAEKVLQTVTGLTWQQILAMVITNGVPAAEKWLSDLLQAWLQQHTK